MSGYEGMVERTVQTGERMVCVNGCQLYVGYTAHLQIVGDRVVATWCAQCAEYHAEARRERSGQCRNQR